jgi:hypothetical protein
VWVFKFLHDSDAGDRQRRETGGDRKVANVHVHIDQRG